jgi:hypothetical protein
MKIEQLLKPKKRLGKKSMLAKKEYYWPELQ